MNKLFSKAKIGKQELKNRIVVPPMCQYSAKNDGKVTNWHLIHYGSLANGAFALIHIEATAICFNGRLTPYDLGLYNDEQMLALKAMLEAIRQNSDAKFSIQLVHSGRKGSSNKPWLEAKSVEKKDGGFDIVAPSALAFDESYKLPKELSIKEIEQIIKDFGLAAKRAQEAKLDMIEIHAAHGYLLHQFLSPITNKRDDIYGGSLENRMRIVFEVFKEVRANFDKEIGIRISATDWIENGWDLTSSIILCQELEKLGLAYIDVSSGGVDPRQEIPICPSYQVSFATKIKENVKIPVICAGLITEPIQAEAIIANNQADFVGVARAALFNPHWPYFAALALGQKEVIYKPQYARSSPYGFKNIFSKEEF